MCRLNPIVWYALLLVVAYAAENQSNSTHEDKLQDDTMHHEPHVNHVSLTWNHDENSTRDDEDSVQHEFYHNYMKNLNKKGSQNMPVELRNNFIDTNNEGNSTTSQLRPRRNSNKTNSKICNDTVCIPICCELGYRMIENICTPDDNEYDFPEIHEIGKKVDEVFPLFVSDPCTSVPRFALDASLYPTDEYIILTNGSLYQTKVNKFIDPAIYCFAVMNKSKYEPTLCFNGPTIDGVDFIAFVIYLSFQATFFWLNVMCFNIWWTFGGFRSSGNVKQGEKKKFIMYSIYAWGCASSLTILCLIMDFVPDIPETLIKPGFGTIRCWFSTNEARSLYFYLPMSITVICNIFLFISTALKIVRYQKETTAQQLKSLESKRHTDNKQWFLLYLKLFIVMGINWSMEILSWLFDSKPPVVWYVTDLINSLQGLFIFIIFVWKDNIRNLLLKRFGCRKDIFSRNSTRSDCYSTSSHTITKGMSLQEKINPYIQNSNCRAKNSSDENSTDCPNV
ncbi:uncharacterized protein LOC116841284 isoform X2 [Odontomachus brunneus]|uniref:uncharacterized protein LOC116841284 isoform X2 n=1 Tax=Odontomachus brunneus TaxID=486640 RepID=UPI0013F1AD92|nr:uncharacterized protein LOC116841284 isoform X2 [Odontomachus brunneus]